MREEAMIKQFSFWFSLFSFSICILNMSGYDANNTVLYFISPPLIILEKFPGLSDKIPNSAKMLLVYFITLQIWYFIGGKLDQFKRKMIVKKKEHHNKDGVQK